MPCATQSSCWPCWASPRARLHRARVAESLQAAAAGFALRVPRSYVARMRPGDPADPLLRARCCRWEPRR